MMDAAENRSNEKPRSNPPSRPPALLRAAEVANYLNIGARTLWRWTSAGRFPRPDLREGRVVRWRRQTVEDWLDAHREQPLR